MGVQRGVLDDRPAAPPKPPPGPRQPVPAGPPSPAAKFYKAKEGFANYYFNELAQKRLLASFAKNGDFSKATGDWMLKLGGKLLAGGGGDATGTALIKEKGAADGKSPKVLLDISDLIFPLEPLQPLGKGGVVQGPAGLRRPGAGAVPVSPVARLRRQGLRARVRPRRRRAAIYPPTANEEKPNYAKIRVMTEVLRAKYAGVETRWYFALEDDKESRWQKGQLIGFEVTPDKDEDPCEVCLSHYKDVGGGRQTALADARPPRRQAATAT